eukprot:712105_1
MFDWLGFKRPHKRAEIVIEVVGADLNSKANRFFDWFSKPDCFVTCLHGDITRKTQVENNTYTPRFLWQAKLPLEENSGFHFQVMENNPILRSEVMGRAFLSAEQAKKLIDTQEPVLLSMGENIGVLKVQLSHPPESLRNDGFTFWSTVPKLNGKTEEMGLKLPRPTGMAE